MSISKANTPKEPATIAILWDMDGVLVDTSEIHYQTWKDTLRDYGIPFPRATFQRIFGMNNRQVLSVILDRLPEPEIVQRISDRKESMFRQAIRGGIELIPGVLDLLQRFQEAGIKQAIASSAPRENIDSLIAELAIQPYFQVIVSGHQLPSKPDPATFLLAAKKLETPPESCLVVEDSTAGVTAAKRAAMACVAITTTHKPEALNGADLIINHFGELSVEKIQALF